jgi:hypothetical protein
MIVNFREFPEELEKHNQENHLKETKEAMEI